MVTNKSLDDSITIICTLLHDVQNVHDSVFNTRDLCLTQDWVRRRTLAEGMGFLTKALPRLGKALDKAISGVQRFDTLTCGSDFALIRGTKLPRFLGPLFEQVFRPDGELLEQPCAQCVQSLRQILYLFYKYKLPYTDEQEQRVIDSFKKTEDDLSTLHPVLQTLELGVKKRPRNYDTLPIEEATMIRTTRRARALLERLFSRFDPLDIHPRHGPGAVATRQRLWTKYQWTNVSKTITDLYPFDAYFMASNGHVSDFPTGFLAIGEVSNPARVCLVPKDSRGPRLISCEPVDYQWVQQGLGAAIVELVEGHYLTKTSVHFTHQVFNRIAALHGSQCGKYATLDLKEASDRVSLELVRLLFPSKVYTYLEACRSSSTVLPSGEELTLRKFAPMGSSLCFPILALTIWAILAAAAPDADTRDRILVYGDDVIVPTAFAVNAIERLESFGLKVNRDKSCTSGLFRESCGMDAFNGKDVTPVKLRAVWSSTPHPDVYESWIAYANSFFDRRYYRIYDCIVERLLRVYGSIPDASMNLSCPSLRVVPESAKPKKSRVSRRYQKRQWLVWTTRAPSVTKSINGWSMLLRFFTESGNDCPLTPREELQHPLVYPIQDALERLSKTAHSVSLYTDRRSNLLIRRWVLET